MLQNSIELIIYFETGIWKNLKYLVLILSNRNVRSWINDIKNMTTIPQLHINVSSFYYGSVFLIRNDKIAEVQTCLRAEITFFVANSSSPLNVSRIFQRCISCSCGATFLR